MTPPEIFVIGGSAGALEPLLDIVGALPDALTVPIAVVLHILPKQPSLIAGLLRAQSSRSVCEPDDKQPIQAGVIYIAPPNYHMLVERTRTIALSVDEAVHFSRPSIDVLFESVASAYGAAAVALLLSGANDDGAAGLARIAAAGGTALVQAPQSATHPAMPLAGGHRAGAARAVTPAEVVPFLVRITSSITETS